MEYVSYYPVKGAMDKHELVLSLERTELKMFKSSDLNNLCTNPKMKEPYLIIEISGVRLPWVLDQAAE